MWQNEDRSSSKNYREAQELRLTRPRFLCSLLVVLMDVFLLTLVSITLWAFVRFFLLEWGVIDRKMFTGGEWIELIKAVIWPGLTFIAIFLFRNPLLGILDELPSFVHRSRFDNRQVFNGYIQDGKGKPTLDTDSGSNEGESPKGQYMRQSSYASNGKVFEDVVISFIQDETWPIVVHRDSTVENSRYRFDAVFEKDGFTYCVEVKKCSSGSFKMVLPLMLNRVDELYLAFTEKMRRRFVFVFCFEGNDDSKDKSKLVECVRLLTGKQYLWEVRVYSPDGKKIDAKRGFPM